MPLPLILMLNGFHGSGKDTLYKLINNYDANYQRCSLADKAKDLASVKYKFDRKLADIHEEKDIPRQEYDGDSLRDIVRKEWMEIYKTDKTKITKIIVEEIKNKLKINPNFRFVVTDFRYDFDYNMLCDVFGKKSILTVKITREQAGKPDRIKEPEEYALEHFTFDLAINNDQTLDLFFDQIKDVL